eukprot:6474290-Amphidinium_carterae.3
MHITQSVSNVLERYSTTTSTPLHPLAQLTTPTKRHGCWNELLAMTDSVKLCCLTLRPYHFIEGLVMP